MLQVTIPARPETELWSEKTEEFITVPAMKEYKLQLEHSLVSLSKWESKWCKPFLLTAKKRMTDAETIDYIRCMTLTQNVPPEVYDNIPDNVIEQVIAYIDSPMTATTFSEVNGGKPNNEVITSELIYYSMIAHNIPLDCQKWHLNRLTTLIRVCSIKNAPTQKMGKQAWLSKQRELNALRRRQLNTKG